MDYYAKGKTQITSNFLYPNGHFDLKVRFFFFSPMVKQRNHFSNVKSMITVQLELM